MNSIAPHQSPPIIVDDNELDYNEADIIENAKAKSIENDMNLRTEMTKGMLSLFVKINSYVLFVVGLAVIVDTALVFQGLAKASDRLVNAQVIMTLIGATTVQLGSAIFTISTNLFPKN